MLTLDREAFIAYVNTARDAFDKAPLSAEQAQLWWDALKSLEFAAIRRALDLHVQRGRFPPRPADVYRRVTGNDRETGSVERSRLCSATDPDGSPCREPWSLQFGDSPPLCSKHHSQRPTKH